MCLKKMVMQYRLREDETCLKAIYTLYFLFKEIIAYYYQRPFLPIFYD